MPQVIALVVIVCFDLGLISLDTPIHDTYPIKPDYKYESVDGVKCSGWDVKEDFIGASPKFWICTDGGRFYDETGAKLPSQFLNQDR